MECAVENSLNKYQNKLKENEIDYEMFCDFIDDDLVEIADMIKKVKQIAKDYNGKDFTEEVEDLIKDLV